MAESPCLLQMNRAGGRTNKEMISSCFYSYDKTILKENIRRFFD
ncbi:hypothetical protein B4168_3524 [Anoxybacillus flavithermus]|nr:hypothetical protein B4168_3524 [Anoxybacillus flavithermus]OAO84652.1 hypothetical protein GT23_3503 [Parageobacillus thermoglucosidasius]